MVPCFSFFPVTLLATVVLRDLPLFSFVSCVCITPPVLHYASDFFFIVIFPCVLLRVCHPINVPA